MINCLLSLLVVAIYQVRLGLFKLEVLHKPALEDLPDLMWQSENERIDGQHEDNPLVVNGILAIRSIFGFLQ